MANILVTGIVTIDRIMQVDSYPGADQELRATGLSEQLGGNAANTARVLAQLGHAVQLLATFSDDDHGRSAAQRLRAAGVHTDHCVFIPHATMPTSHILRSAEQGSRSIVHFRQLDELPAQALQGVSLQSFDWLHFEGRNLPALRAMLAACRARSPQLPISIEIEKRRQDIDSLYGLADLGIFARAYLDTLGYESPHAFVAAQRDLQQQALVFPWGPDGAFAHSRDGGWHHSPPYRHEPVVDTLAAGDVFNAGLIDQLAGGASLTHATDRATRLAGQKCTQYGLENLPAPA